jgi:hypothetical protein
MNTHNTQHITPQSIQSYKQNQFPRNTLHWMLQNAPSLLLCEDLLSIYKLNYWSGKYILQEMQQGMIWNRGKWYHVAFDPKVTRGHIMRQSKLEQYSMSWREAIPIYNLPPYVYISTAF